MTIYMKIWQYALDDSRKRIQGAVKINEVKILLKALLGLFGVNAF